jgi:hypothetical protein
LKFSFRTIGISTTCFASTRTAVGDGFLNQHNSDRRCYVDVEVEMEVVVAGMASAIAKSAAHKTTENFMLRIQVVEGVVNVEER